MEASNYDIINYMSKRAKIIPEGMPTNAIDNTGIQCDSGTFFYLKPHPEDQPQYRQGKKHTIPS